jgi:hypothetical protein
MRSSPGRSTGRYAAAALDLLQWLRKEGYFEASEKAAQLRKDDDLMPLHVREGFKKLLEAVGQK